MLPLNCLLLLILCGCSDGTSTQAGSGNSAVPDTIDDGTTDTTEPEEKAEARHVAEFRHTFPDEDNAGSGSIRIVRTPGQPFYGFDGENYTSETELDGNGKDVNFRMTLIDHRDGKDIYKITRTVTVRRADGGTVSETTGTPETVTVEYAGEELTVFDDEVGVSKFIPVESTREQR